MLILQTYKLLRLLLFPMVRLFCFFSPKLKTRYEREVKINEKKSHFKAHYAFEISSEGELEQIRPLLEDFLEQGFLVELIFCSESVWHKCLELEKKYSHRLRLFMMPFLSYLPFFGKKNLSSLVSAPNLILCRYDFFPELWELAWGRKLMILAATAKGLKKGFSFKKIWYEKFFKKAEMIVTSTESCLGYFKKRYPQKSIESFDFRQVRIMQRILKKEDKFQSKYPQIKQLRNRLEKTPYNLILGSLWEEDLVSLDDSIWDMAKRGKLLIYILPHKLNEKNLQNMTKALKRKQVELGEFVFLEVTKGILCELYDEFDNSFVGGGHENGAGVHSLLEPYMANCRLFCGQRVERSTEYSFILESGGEVFICSSLKPLKEKQLKIKEDHLKTESHFYEELLTKYQNIKKRIGGLCD